MRTVMNHTEALQSASAKPWIGLLLIKVQKTMIDVLNYGSLKQI